MFLVIAYSFFIAQILTILFLISPVSIRIKRYIIEKTVSLSGNIYIKTLFMIGVAIMSGLFVENLLTVLKYNGIRHEFSDTILTTAYASKYEIMLKLFRSQRNMYLTFIINFNWIIIYSIQKLIKHVYNLESDDVSTVVPNSDYD